MSYDFCLSCGVLLAPGVVQCPVCGFDNAFDEQEDPVIDDRFIHHFNDEFILDGDYPD